MSLYNCLKRKWTREVFFVFKKKFFSNVLELWRQTESRINQIHTCIFRKPINIHIPKGQTLCLSNYVCNLFI